MLPSSGRDEDAADENIWDVGDFAVRIEVFTSVSSRTQGLALHLEALGRICPAYSPLPMSGFPSHSSGVQQAWKAGCEQSRIRPALPKGAWMLSDDSQHVNWEKRTWRGGKPD